VYWENAPDYRTSRTLDWLNDACEAKLKKKDRDQGVVKYLALMSPASVRFISRGTALSFDTNHLFTQANRAKLRLGKGQYLRRFPISLLLTTELTTTDDNGAAQQIHPYVLLGTKKPFGRRAAVSRYERAQIECDSVRRVAAIPRRPARRVAAIRRQLVRRVRAVFGHQAAATPSDPARRLADHFQCMLHVSTVDPDAQVRTADVDVRFPTEFEAHVLFEHLKSRSELKSGLAFMHPRGRSPLRG